jgi:hypothetical protein
VKHDQMSDNATARRRAWRATLKATPAWLSSADLSDPSDAELDAIWEAGGCVAEGRPFAACHLLAAYRAGVAAASASDPR